jgi:hypothetical protein
MLLESMGSSKWGLPRVVPQGIPQGDSTKAGHPTGSPPIGGTKGVHKEGFNKGDHIWGLPHQESHTRWSAKEGTQRVHPKADSKGGPSRGAHKEVSEIGPSMGAPMSVTQGGLPMEVPHLGSYKCSPPKMASQGGFPKLRPELRSMNGCSPSDVLQLGPTWWVTKFRSPKWVRTRWVPIVGPPKGVTEGWSKGPHKFGNQSGVHQCEYLMEDTKGVPHKWDPTTGTPKCVTPMGVSQWGSP